MDDFETSASTREIIKDKLRQNFDGKIVRKDLTKKSRKAQMCLPMSLSSSLGSIAVRMMTKLFRRA